MDKNLVLVVSHIAELAHKLIVLKLNENGINNIVPSHGDILHLLFLKERVTMKEIAQFIHKTKPTVTVLVDKLINLDYVCKEKDENDSRVTYIKLTSKGKSFQPVFQQISDELNQIVYQNLSSCESKQIENLLNRVLDSLKDSIL